MSEHITEFDWCTYLNKYEDLRRAGIHTQEDAWKHWNKYGRKEGRTDKYTNPPFNDADIDKCPTLFHKYSVKISSYTTPIVYRTVNIVIVDKKAKCHFHIHDIETFGEYRSYLDILKGEFDVIITYNVGEPPISDMPYTILQVENKGFDIGPKLCMLQYLLDTNKDYTYILFLHSKTNTIVRKKLFETFLKNSSRLKLVQTIMETNPNLMGIFPDWTYVQEKQNHFLMNFAYVSEILNYLHVPYKTRYLAAGNIMVLRKPVIDRMFHNNLNIFYNLLNDYNSFDLNWYVFVNKLRGRTREFAYNHFQSSKIKIGNNLPFIQSGKSIADGMIEHAFERLWTNIIHDIHGDFLILPEQSLIDRYNIKLNAIYFPQFHEIQENNEFWGDKFTEWTLLKPFPDRIRTSFGEIPIYKPHEDIGYYDLGQKETLLKQISIAKSYNINGFIVYHYWFHKNKIVMKKPLEYFLDDEIQFPFSISWANENWTKRWDGGNNELLIEQTYDDHLEHIQYLIQFFKRPNYIRNADNENILYIYRIDSIPNYNEMINTWKSELAKHGLKIKIVATENNFTNVESENARFMFEPIVHIRECFPKKNGHEHSLSYEKIVNLYCNNKRTLPKAETHFGLPLYWNNIIRRQNRYFYLLRDFTMSNLEKFLLVLLSRIVMKYKNIIDVTKLPNYENFINVNAWNEWNEQAVLEPNNVTGYQNLETIRNIVHDL